MELLLSVALAAAAIAAATGWIRRNEERARAQRFADELAALRRSSAAGHRVAEFETGVTPALSPSFAEAEEPASDGWREERLSQVRRLVEAAEEALAAASARPRPPSAVPPETLRQEALDLLTLLERVEASFAPLPEKGAALATERSAPAPAAAPGIPVLFDASGVASGLRAADDLADTAGRLKDSLSGLARTTDRLREATAASSAALTTVARGAEGVAPMAGALSAVANRVNLLALNLAVLVSPGAATGANVEEAGTELRSIFEEARRLSREIGASSQRVASAARSAAEQGTALASAIDEERVRVERGVLELGALDGLAVRMREAFESVRRAARESDEGRSRLQGDLAAAVEHTALSEIERAAYHGAASTFTADVCGACASVTEARIAAERSVRHLLAVAESAADRRAMAPDTAVVDALREAKKLLS